MRNNLSILFLFLFLLKNVLAQDFETVNIGGGDHEGNGGNIIFLQNKFYKYLEDKEDSLYCAGEYFSFRDDKVRAKFLTYSNEEIKEIIIAKSELYNEKLHDFFNMTSFEKAGEPFSLHSFELKKIDILFTYEPLKDKYGQDAIALTDRKNRTITFNFGQIKDSSYFFVELILLHEIFRSYGVLDDDYSYTFQYFIKRCPL